MLMKKKQSLDNKQRRDILNRLPRIFLGILMILLGILCFTNGDVFSRFLKWVSVYIFGIMFFVLGLGLVGVGIYFLIAPISGDKHKIHWLDISMVIVAFFSLSVLLSCMDNLSNMKVGDFTSTYANLMANNSPSGFYVEIPSRISMVGGGFIPTLFVSLGNTIGMGLLGTRILFGVLLGLSILVLLRYPAITLSHTIARIRKEHARNNIQIPVVERSSDLIEDKNKNSDIEIKSQQTTIIDSTNRNDAVVDNKFYKSNDDIPVNNISKENSGEVLNKTIAVEKNDVVDKKVDNVVEQVPVSEHKDEINNKDSSSFFNDYDDDSFESEVSIFDNGFGKDLVNNDENQEQRTDFNKDTKIDLQNVVQDNDSEDDDFFSSNPFSSKVDNIKMTNISSIDNSQKNNDSTNAETLINSKNYETEEVVLNKTEEITKEDEKEELDLPKDDPIDFNQFDHSSNVIVDDDTDIKINNPIQNDDRLSGETLNDSFNNTNDNAQKVESARDVVYRNEGFSLTQTDEQIAEDQQRADLAAKNRRADFSQNTTFELPKIETEDTKPDENDEDQKPVEPIKEQPEVDQPIVITTNKKYVLPDDQYLMDFDNSKTLEEIKLKDVERGYTISNFFKQYGIKASCTGFDIGAAFSCFHINLEPGVRMSSIENVMTNLSVTLEGNSSVRFLPLISGKSFSGIEVANPVSMTVPFKELYDYLMSIDPKCEKKLLMPLGKDAFGRILTTQLNELPHLLVAGTTGSGKSVFIQCIIMSILMRTYPNEVKFVLIDPKKVEFSRYADMPHLYCPVITEPEKAVVALSKLTEEMDRRFGLFLKAGAQKYESYQAYCKKNPKAEKLPYIVVIIDEFADLMTTSNGAVAKDVGRLGAKARACGIHLIIATQRPSVSVISGDIKANIVARVCLMVSSGQDSRVILDENGAEQLVGKGDLLAKIPNNKGMLRCQSGFISDDEMSAVVNYLKQRAQPVYNSEFLSLDAEPVYEDLSGEDGKKSIYDRVKSDPMYSKAKETVTSTHRATASYLSREMNIPYNKASDYLDAMDIEGITKRLGNGKHVLTSDLEDD